MKYDRKYVLYLLISIFTIIAIESNAQQFSSYSLTYRVLLISQLLSPRAGSRGAIGSVEHSTFAPSTI